MNEKVEQYVEAMERSVPKIVSGLRFSMSNAHVKTELNLSQELVLIAFAYKNAYKMSELAGETGISLTALTGVIDSLIRKEYVVRVHSLDDRRVVIVKLEKAGQKVAQLLQQNRKKSIRFVVEALGEREREFIIKGFERLVDIFSAQEREQKKNYKVGRGRE